MAFIKKMFPGVRKWVFNLSGYNKYGLLYDDILQETDDVLKAIERLPHDVREARNFRVMRAFQLECRHRILPKEEWTKFEDDIRYLQPYVEQVKKEREEKEYYNANN